MGVLKLHSTIANGQLSPEAQIAFTGALKQHEGQRVTVEVKKQVKRRSNQQSRFYRGVVVPMVVQLFWACGDPISKAGAHRYLKETIGGFVKEVTAPDGRITTEVLSSKDFSTKQWEDWLDAIRAWAAPFGLQIPYPNENIDYSTLEDDDYDATNLH